MPTGVTEMSKHHRIAVLLALVPAVTVAGCGAGTASPATTSAPVEQPATAEHPATAISPGSPGAPETDAAVVSRRIAVADPELGPLTFDALTAGDPSLAAQGRLVLLLHGFPQGAEAYREILPGLAAAGYFAVAFDQRGYSPDARPPEVASYGILHLLADTLGVASALGAGRFHLVGHDWGGGVAWLAAAARPDLVTTLTVLSTPHPDALSDGIADPSHPQHLASAYMQRLRDIDEAELTDGLASVAERFGADAEPIPDGRAVGYAARLADPVALRAALDWYRATPLPNPGHMGPVHVPTLYMWGAKDFTFVRRTVEETEPLVAAPYTFVELADLGHWLPEGAPDRVTRALVRHLDDHGGPEDGP